jgi:heme oxygenase
METLEANSTRLQDAPARSHLLEATRAAHARLESILPLASPQLTLREYSNVLRTFLSIYTVLEAQIELHGPELARWDVDWPRRRKLPLLLRDAEALAAMAPAVWPAPSPDAVLRLLTPSHAMGCLYVLEGATLGGKVIARNVRRVLGLGPDNGASFFDSYGSAAATSWQAFCAALERCLPDEASRAQAADAATATFRLFAERLAHQAA